MTAPILSPSGRYYIQHTTSWSGDDVCWWRPNRTGYTYNLDEAGIYDEPTARRIEAIRGQDLAVPVEVAEKAVSRHVTGAGLDRELERASAEGSRCMYGTHGTAAFIMHDSRGCYPVCPLHARWRRSTSRTGGHGEGCRTPLTRTHATHIGTNESADELLVRDLDEVLGMSRLGMRPCGPWPPIRAAAEESTP